MSRRNGAGDSLERAQAVLAETDARLAALVKKRNTALLNGSDADVALVDEEIEGVQKLLRTHTDRVSLLAAERQRSEAARRAKEHEALITRVEGKLAERDCAVAELAGHVAAADAALVKVFALNREILAGWPWGNGHLGAVLLGDGATLNALRNEIYRVSGRPPSTGGMPGDPRGPSYPGGQCEQLEWIMMPERIRPMVEKFAQASAAGSVIMKTGRNGPAPATNGAVHPEMNGNSPTEQLAPSTPSPSEKASPEMIRLLSRQNELVGKPMGADEDAEYESISKRIRQLAELGEGVSQ
jgi:hypothetical protein